jgi:hypothetical protein
MIPQKQLSLADVYENCKNIFESDKPKFLSILEEYISLDDLIPSSFVFNFYAQTGRPRDYSLHSMLWALIIQKIFSIPTDTLLITFLNYSKVLRDFCGFTKVPDGSKITRFKQDFVSDLETMFNSLVDITEPICQQIDAHKASMTIFDSSGIEAYVTENNPKYLNTIIKQIKYFKKSNNIDNSYDPYKAAYVKMPSHASSNKEIKQQYINGHFCYAYKFGLITNGLGIVRNISFLNKDFLTKHPEITVEKKSDSPNEDKTLHDSKALLPILKDFFNNHPQIKPNIFIGDSAFDSNQIYKGLLKDLKFNKAFIPINKRSTFDNQDYHINEAGIPCCPHDKNLPMVSEGIAPLRSGIVRYKFVCPKMKWITVNGRNKRKHFCDNPCTDSFSGRMIYVYPEKDLRTYPGTLRDTDQWVKTYKLRSVVEKSINHFKDSFCLANRKTQNEKTTHADLLLAGLTQLITVILADKLHQYQFIRSLKPLIA